MNKGIPHSASSGRQFLGRLLEHHRRDSLLSLLLMAVTGLLNGLGILLLIPMLRAIGLDAADSELPGSSGGGSVVSDWVGTTLNLPGVLLLFVCLSVLHAVLIRAQTFVNARLKEDVVHSLRMDLYEAISRCTWIFFVGRQSSDFTHALTDNLKRVTAGTLHGLRLVSAVLVATIQIGATLIISPVMSLTAITCGVVLWSLLSRQNRSVAATGRELTTVNRSFFARLANHLAGMKEAKSLGAEEQNIASVQEQSEQLRSSHLRLTDAMATTTAVHSVGAAVILSSLLFIACEVLHTPVASMAALIVVASRVLPRLRDMHAGYLSVLQMLPAFSSTMELIRQCRQHPDITPQKSSDRLSLKQGLQFRDVRFRYSDESCDWTLQNINLHIPAGRITAVTGPSGAGKSTLADLLLTLLRPSSGCILLDEQPLSDGQIPAWRQLIGYVPQETFSVSWITQSQPALGSTRRDRLRTQDSSGSGVRMGVRDSTSAGSGDSGWRSGSSSVRWRTAENCSCPGFAAQAGNACS